MQYAKYHYIGKTMLTTQVNNIMPDYSFIYHEKDRLGYENALHCLGNPNFLMQPDWHGCEFIAKKLNKVAKKVYWELRSVLYRAPEHLARINILENQPRVVGKNNFNMRTAILGGATAFEQMCALDDWLSRHLPLTEKRTFCLANTKYNKYVPLSIELSKGKAHSLMQVKLGFSNSREHKAPVYQANWDTNDPWQSDDKINFIYHMEALEIVRQPKFIATTLLKGNAFEAELIDEDIRYGTYGANGEILSGACVEFKDQNRLPLEELAIKTRSAAHILFELDRKNFERQLLTDEETNICSNTNYEDYDVVVTPRAILESLKDSLDVGETKNKGETRLYQLLFKAFIVKIGMQSTPSLHEYIIRRLEAFEELN